MKASVSNDPPSLMAVIPAAGNGSRMQSRVPKQFLTVADKTLLEYSIEAVCRDSRVEQVFIAVSNPDTDYFVELKQKQPTKVHFVKGGNSRAESVLAGIKAATSQGATHVLVHDAARPCLPETALKRVIDEGLKDPQGAILAIPVRDSLKRAVVSSQGDKGSAHIESSVEREALWQAQTPQVFNAERLQQAIEHMGALNPQLTDEASAMQWCGFQPALIPGSIRNLKVTHPEDFECVRDWLLVINNKEESRS
ncbi:2-C-methyl-D-erythritol 4-phosphate cytidylyltransferase [Idiomarina ramblicola]|uniref:2-C-methyl-D-erythritol 4-phosphate cytidylyltransferase n=1 Tax=Idiomarina ramblicola TaxID=263724 RepID=A0A432YYP8_9GAMM|nr:2-C-methyl-D-erythritol 4-phosphate cytidylyltransferase [Idiomarina ramblicola]RUO68725.1 2-C-methyl-D-erythritol 4-phosphate cytidylyltransferase [Idiomarina ramblicola]